MGTDRDNIDVHGNYIGGPSQVSGTQHNYFTAAPQPLRLPARG